MQRGQANASSGAAGDSTSETIAGPEAKLPDRKTKTLITHSVSIRANASSTFHSKSVEMLISLTNETMGTHITFQHIQSASNNDQPYPPQISLQAMDGPESRL